MGIKGPNLKSSCSNTEKEFNNAWQSYFQRALDSTVFEQDIGPLWSLTVLQSKELESKVFKFGLFFAFNHAISDQMSVNYVLDDMLANIDLFLREKSESTGPAREKTNFSSRFDSLSATELNNSLSSRSATSSIDDLGEESVDQPRNSS